MNTLTTIRGYSQTLYALICSDLHTFRYTFHNTLIDRSIFTLANIVLVIYILPSFGISAGFSMCMIGSLLSSTSIFEITPFIAQFIHDLEGPRKITYELILPMPSWLVLLKSVIVFSLKTIFYTLCTLPIMKLLLGNALSLSTINWPAFLCMVVVNSLFAGCFGLLLTSITPSLRNLGNIWSRFIYPLWFFGGFQFSWAALHKSLGAWAYLDLINPVLYANEGFRDALFYNQGFMNVWYCIPVLLFFSMLTGWLAIKKFRQRLDFI